jgi:hypothetical protein
MNFFNLAHINGELFAMLRLILDHVYRLSTHYSTTTVSVHTYTCF